LCQAFVTGPEDCQTVALVMSDPELKAEWARGRAEWMKEHRKART
jgi:aspartate/tyrosine/aromatic aminotransferase